MSGGRITLAIYIAIGFIPVAFGQSSTHYKTRPETLRQVEQSGTNPPGWKPVAVRTVPVPTPGEIVVINYGHGGRLDEHNWRFGAYKRANTRVEIRGPCLSACTLVTAYVSKDKLCIAAGAYLAFHAVRSLEGQQIMPAETALLYLQYPADIRSWIDRTGGYQNLPLDGFWPLHDRELWAMGYPKCQ